MRKIKNILFIGFKNKASFAFLEPLVINLLKERSKDKYIINTSLSPSLLLDFLLQKVFRNFSKLIQDNVFLIHIFVPDFNDFFLNSQDKRKLITLIKYFVLEYFLLVPAIILYFFTYKKIPSFLTKSKIVFTRKFSLILLSGTGHISGQYLLSSILSNSIAKYKLIWLPHAPHYGSSEIDMPISLLNSKSKVEYWIPLPDQNINSNNKNISTFSSGYPPFASDEILKIRNEIYKKRPCTNIHNLIVVLRKTESYGFTASPYTYNFDQTLYLLENLSTFVESNNISRVNFCLHPSTNLRQIQSLIKKYKWPKYNVSFDYFLSFANKNSFVVGSYSSVLLHSALAGLPTICFKDHIIDRIEKEETLMFDLYRNSPIYFCNRSYKSLNKVYKSIDRKSFVKFSIKNISKENSISNPYYLIQLADNNFNKSLERIKFLS